MTHEKGFIIAIDGPVAAGKSTIAPKLASKLKGFYFWTGAMYRCLALHCIENTIDLSNEKAVVSAAGEIASAIDFDISNVIFYNKDVTKRLKEKDTAEGSSVVAAYGEARRILIKHLKEIVHNRAIKGEVIVVEGRDTGTKVFPHAALKIFLTANPEIRAKRRVAQIQAKGQHISYDEVLKDIQERDERDMNRKAGPLVRDPENHGYFVVNDSFETREETLEVIMGELRRRKLY